MTKGTPRPKNKKQKSDWWQRFLAMPDARRAEILAKISVWTIIALLYILGGVSLYLRARYLPFTPPPTSPQTATTSTPTQEPTAPKPTKTLYPSRTPKPDSTSNRNETAEWVVFIRRDDTAAAASI